MDTGIFQVEVTLTPCWSEMASKDKSFGHPAPLSVGVEWEVLPEEDAPNVKGKEKLGV